MSELTTVSLNIVLSAEAISKHQTELENILGKFLVPSIDNLSKLTIKYNISIPNVLFYHQTQKLSALAELVQDPGVELTISDLEKFYSAYDILENNLANLLKDISNLDIIKQRLA